MLEVLYEIDLLDTPNNEIKILKHDFDKIISSFEICKAELMDIVTQLKQYFHNILDLNQQ